MAIKGHMSQHAAVNALSDFVLFVIFVCLIGGISKTAKRRVKPP
jgi:hypothetical protein